jgi:hypothetical protein
LVSNNLRQTNQSLNWFKRISGKPIKGSFYLVEEDWNTGISAIFGSHLKWTKKLAQSTLRGQKPSTASPNRKQAETEKNQRKR